MTSLHRPLAWLGLAVLAILAPWWSSACTESPGANLDGAAELDGAAGVDAVVDARTEDVAEPDAALWPDAAPRPIWDAGPSWDATPGSLIKLPPNGVNPMMGVGFEYPYVAYSEQRNADLDIFLFDLTTRVETPVCTEAGDQTFPQVTNGWVLWSDARFQPSPGAYVSEIFGYEIATGITRQLTFDGYGKRLDGATATHLLYSRRKPGEHSELVLEDRTTGETRVLCLGIYGPQGASLNQTHVAWASLDPNFGWAVRSVYFQEIATGETWLISSPGDAWNTSLAGDWLVWSSSWGNYDVYAYQLSTGEVHQVTDEPHDQIGPSVGGSLVTFMDFRYTGGWFHNSDTLNDLVVQDLETGVWRKLTSTSSRCAPCGRPQAGWQVFIGGRVNPFGYEVWALDMEANEIVDATGHVIPPP